jgi:hypothetical protein
VLLGVGLVVHDSCGEVHISDWLAEGEERAEVIRDSAVSA